MLSLLRVQLQRTLQLAADLLSDLTGGLVGLAMMAGAAILSFAAMGGSLFLRVPAAVAASVAVAFWRVSQSRSRQD